MTEADGSVQAESIPPHPIQQIVALSVPSKSHAYVYSKYNWII